MEIRTHDGRIVRVGDRVYIIDEWRRCIDIRTVRTISSNGFVYFNQPTRIGKEKQKKNIYGYYANAVNGIKE
jgi:hypothetical protein